MIKKFLAFSEMKLNGIKEHKVNFLLSVLTTPIEITIVLLVWKIIYSASQQINMGGLDINSTLLYFVYLYTIAGFGKSGGLIDRIEKRINKGDISVNLCRPVHILLGMFASKITEQIIYVYLLKGIFFFTIIFILKLKFNAIWLFLALISSLLGYIISIQISMCIGLTAFWIKRTIAIKDMRDVVESFFSGKLIPLTIMPQIFQNIAWYTPFPYLAFVPGFIFLGKYTFLNSIRLMAIQIVFIILSNLLLRFLWNSGLKKFESEGG